MGLDFEDSVGRELSGWMDLLPGVDPGAEAASQRIRRISRLLGSVLARIAVEHELSVGDWESLSVLRRSGAPYECSPKKLAEKLGVTSGTMSVRIGRLAKAGLVESATSVGDGRNKPIRLTERGSGLWQAATERRTDYEQGLLADALTPGELEQLNPLLGKLLFRFEEDLGPAPTHGSLRREAG